MATRRPKVPSAVKRVLIEEAGRKCANPGCPNRLVELHHIEEWHIYQTHDEKQMIAICAACHDSVDRGELQISDEDLYRWKGIPRDVVSTAHLFVEPGSPTKMLLGSIAVQGDSGLVVFDFTDLQRLSFAVKDGDIMLLNAKLSRFDGKPLLDIVDGYVRQRADEIELATRPGRVQVPAGIHSPLIPEWARTSLLMEDPLYGVDGLSLIDLEVVEPGLVRVQGIWMDEDKGVIVTNDRLSFVGRGRPKPLTIVGTGKDSVLHYVGPLGTALFGVG
jgi:hypothetical protein